MHKPNGIPWIILDPQPVLDQEADKVRPLDWSLEVGLKLVH